MADDTKADQADDATDEAVDPRLRPGQNEASVTPNPRSFANADEAQRAADDAAFGADQGPKYDPNTGKQLRD